MLIENQFTLTGKVLMAKALTFQNLQYLKKKDTSQVLKKYQYNQRQQLMKIMNM